MTIHRFKKITRRSIFTSALCTISFLITAGAAFGTESASATFTDSIVSPGVWQYNLNLSNTGTTTLGTFWFSWIPGDNFMPATPTGITDPANWTNVVTTGGPSGGSAILWKASQATADLISGGSLSGFSFDSAVSPAQLEAASNGSPAFAVDTAVVYSGAPFSDAGFTLQVTPAPEPAGFLLCGLGLGTVLMGFGLARRS